MMDEHAFIAVASGMIVLFGVYAFFRLLKYVADFAIFLIALADAVVACNIYLWYATLTGFLAFLPTEFGFKGWAICVGSLTALGAVIALPLIPFSSTIQSMRASGLDRIRRRPGHHHPLAKPGVTPEGKTYQWDSYQDLEG